MGDFLADVLARLNSGRVDVDLSDLTRDWRADPSDYSIGNAVRCAADENRGDDLIDTLLDPQFQQLRQLAVGPAGHVEGVNALGGDLRIARDHFLKNSPDLLRYLQVVLVQQHPFANSGSVEAQRARCRGYAEFLQLDRLPHEREDIGLHHVVQHLFTAKDRSPSDLRLRLVGYELGRWTCSCGQLTGLDRRYDHHCPCGEVAGHGRLPRPAPDCGSCGAAVGYAVCPGCRTRVTLANLWQLRRGGTGPDDFLVPLTLDLRVDCESGELSREPGLLLTWLPLPIGVREREEEVGFDPPAVFWASERVEQERRDLGDRFFAFEDTIEYDKQGGFQPALLAAMLRRTLLRHRSGYDRFNDMLLGVLMQYDTEERVRPDLYTRGFWNRLRKVAVADLGPGELVGRGAVTFQCTVAASPRLRGRVAVVAKDLATANDRAVPVLHQVGTTLDKDAILTPSPPGVAAELAAHLDEYGLTTPGQKVLPGQPLVGISAPKAPEAPRTPEEGLLESIFPGLLMEDRSLRMPGDVPGHVLDQCIDLGLLKDHQVPAAVGRRSNTGVSLTTRVTVTVAVDHHLREGDVLASADGADAVVCGLVGSAVLERLAANGASPDIVVAPDHPWAPPAGESVRTVVVSLSAGELASRDTSSHDADSGHSLVLHQPLQGDGGAQLVEAADFRWLAEHGARHLAMELHGPRSDCTAWRARLVSGSERNGLAPLGPPDASPAGLGDAEGRALRRLDSVLRAARVVATLEGDRTSFRLMTDNDVVTQSHGQVQQPDGIDYRTTLPKPGGIQCQRIFGPVRNDVCPCGEPRFPNRTEGSCRVCGRTVVPVSERARRFGHVELPVSVVHGWYLHGPACTRLAAAIGVTERQLREIADCLTHVVTEPGSTGLRPGHLLDADELARHPGRHELSTVTGGQAVKILLSRASTANDHGPPPVDTSVIRRIPVLPPDLRPLLRMPDGSWGTSDLNSLYHSVLTRAAVYRRRQDEGADPKFLYREQRELQQAVTRLLANRDSPDPAAIRGGHVLVSLADHLTPRPTTTGTLREALLLRAVDHSARARLVISRSSSPDVDSPDTVVLPQDTALRLLRPLVVHALVSAGAAPRPRDARTMIRARSAAALESLEAVCARAVVLLGLPHGPWPLLAVRVRPSVDTTASAVVVQPALLDRIGWENLGENVRVLSVLSQEAQQEATRFLTVEALHRRPAPPKDQPTASGSFFDLPCSSLTGRIADTARMHGSMPLVPDDALLLCDPSWLTGHQPDPPVVP
ncbi:hypothetical protein [Streptomyces sp. NBC_00105]|uniref:hypothetical protein n=1 Tax=Streptomyces sp. NBC_00105 TaxID=2903622 RepID=UPI00324F4399